MKERMERIISQKTVMITLYMLFALLAGIQSLTITQKQHQDGTIKYTSYNNYVIYSQSFQHLKNHQDLYILYPEEHWDLFKYTPTFSVFFGLFTLFPDWLGLNLWNLLNALVLLFAIYYLPRLSNTQKGWILLIILLEFVGSVMCEQSNALVAGLMVFSFGLLENRRFWLASLCIVISIFIKLFGIVGLALFLFYPQKWKLALYTLCWTILLLILPFIFIDYQQYLRLLSSYGNLLSNDLMISNGFSIMGWLNSWFSMEINKTVVVLTGAGLFLLPFIRYRAYKYLLFRYLTLSSILIWVVIFNHKAESPTFIIAMTGVAIWFISGEKKPLNIILLFLAILFVSLTSTDLFPAKLKTNFIQAYALKALPCILIWFKIIYDMLVLGTDWHLSISEQSPGSTQGSDEFDKSATTYK